MPSPAVRSQGFRHGGRNSGPLTGPFQESPLLSSYAPDRTNNYWRATLYMTNLADKQEILAPPMQVNEFDNLTNDYLVNMPRVIELRLAYMF